MGFWECDDGTMVEMIFDDQGDFVKFGDDIKEKDAEKAKKEIVEKTAILMHWPGCD